MPQVLPADFDASEYLKLNPDVAEAGANAVDHYIKYGIAEGRRYLESHAPRIRCDVLGRLKHCRTILEIGPFDTPIAPAYSNGATIEYVDWQPQEELVARATSIGGRRPERVPKIHYVVNDGNYAGKVPRKFDAVVSSHMIEHTPDLIFHLQQVRGVLVSGGSYLVVLPDKRRCFDQCLPVSTLPEVLAAHLERRTRPSLRSVIEHRAFTNGQFPMEKDPVAEPTPHVFELAKRALEEFNSHDYVDVHCWQFTPASLRQIVEGIVGLGLLPRPQLLQVSQIGVEIGMQIKW